MGRSRCRITELDRAHFVTCSVLDWPPVFTRPETVGMLLDAPVVKQRHCGLRVYARAGAGSSGRGVRARGRSGRGVSSRIVASSGRGVSSRIVASSRPSDQPMRGKPGENRPSAVVSNRLFSGFVRTEPSLDLRRSRRPN
jgi:hypothetical protein